MKRMFFLKHSPIDVLFTKNSNDFVVKELPLYEFSGEGEHLILHIRKKDTTTWQAVQKLSEVCGAKVRDFGYAGLKDKDGMTTQYISIHKNYEEKLKSFQDEKIKILSTTYHNNKIRVGHLKGNRFFLRLKRVNPVDAKKLESALKTLAKDGYPNFFGYQRFGIEQDNYEKGLEILSGKRRERKRKVKDFLISSYQSYLFNTWLSKRIEIGHILTNFDAKESAAALDFDIELVKSLQAQTHFIKLFKGDIAHHYPAGKPFICEEVETEAKRFDEHDITLTGWLPGKRSMRAEDTALELEDKIYKEALPYIDKMNGARRFAWSFLEDVECEYREDEKWFEMNFSLQKGSYATVILEELLHTQLKA